MIKVLLIDDHRILREGVRSILASEAGVTVVGEAGDGREGLELARRLDPDVVVLDIGMPNLNGVDACRALKRDNPDRHIVALSMHQDERHVMAMLEAGAGAYVAKDASGAELTQAVRAVVAGRKYIGTGVAGAVVSRAIAPAHANALPRHNVGELTGREREVLQLIAEGKTSGEIAAELCLSPGTIDTHRRNLMRKTDLHSVAELTKFAVREGLTPL